MNESCPDCPLTERSFLGPWRLNRLMHRWVRSARYLHSSGRSSHFDHHLHLGPMAP